MLNTAMSVMKPIYINVVVDIYSVQRKLVTSTTIRKRQKHDWHLAMKARYDIGQVTINIAR
jgi:hypothetical protein